MNFQLPKVEKALKTNVFGGEAERNENENIVGKKRKREDEVFVVPGLKNQSIVDVNEEDAEAISELKTGISGKRDGIAIAKIDKTDPEYAEAPTAESYKKMPVEEFGWAALRGLGWNGKRIASSKTVKTGKLDMAPQRPIFLGLGAKERTWKTDESGAWGKGALNDRTYNPVVRRNKRTGEVMTAEEGLELGKEREREERKKAR